MIFNIDVDNTINNFVHEFIFLYNNITGRNIEYKNMTDYDLTSLDIDNYTLETLFLKNNRFYETLVPKVGSVSTIKKLIVKEHIVKFVTSIHYNVIQARIDFIAKYFPAVDVNKSLIVTDDKHKIYADFVIDDLPSNVTENVNSSCNYILIKQPWNTEQYNQIKNKPLKETCCYCCKDWFEIHSLLKTLSII